MSNFLTAFVHVLPVLVVVAFIAAAAWTTVRGIDWWADRRVARSFREAGVQYGPRVVYGPLPALDATDAEFDDYGRRLLGLPDPFEMTLREIRALPKTEVSA